MTLSKKIFIISSALLATFLIFWGIYNLSFKKPVSTKPTSTSEKNEPVVIPKTSSSKITPISDEAVLSPALTPDKMVIKYYSKNTGKVYQIDLDGTNKKTISTKELPGLASVSWSPDTTKVISQINSESEKRFYYYDYAKGEGIQLKNNLDTVTWQNDNKILYKFFDPKTKQRTLNIANPDGSGWSKLADLDARYISIAPVPKTGLISFWNSPDSFAETLFQSAPIIGGEKKTLFSGKFGADFLWSLDGNMVLTSNLQEKTGHDIQLAITNDRGGEYKNLEIPTMVSKCVWSKDNKTVFYALPGNIPANAILPNEYREGKFNTIDTFWKVNTVTGEKSRIIDLDKIGGEYDATNLFLNSDESVLFFINRTDGKLYRVDL